MDEKKAQTVDDLKQRKDLAQAETEALTAEIALEEVRKRSRAARVPVDTAPARADESAATVKVDKSPGATQPSKGEAAPASLAGLASSGITGTVTVTDKGGLLETALLAAVATETAARRIAGVVKPLLESRPKATLYVFAQSQLPAFLAAGSFKAQQAVVRRALDDAVSAAEEEGRESLAQAGLAIESITKLLGYFRSDYSLGGVDFTPDDVALLQAALAQPLGAGRVVAPALYNPAAVRDTGSLAAAETVELGRLRGKASSLGQRLDDAVRKAEAQAADVAVAEPERKAALAEAAGRRALADRLRAAIAAHDTLLTRLLANDDAAQAMLRELSVFNALQEPDSYLLLLKMHKAAGSHYTEKNLWNALGKMPFFVAGGVVVSYTLLTGLDGDVLRAGLLPIHGGFAKVQDVPADVNLRY